MNLVASRHLRLALAAVAVVGFAVAFQVVSGRPPPSSPSSYPGLAAAYHELALTLDRDGDGYPLSDDCDDTDRLVSPAATETCDGVDQDCDGVVDDDPVDANSWYPDADGDGYGVEEGSYDGCPLDGYASQSGDCDETEPSRHPDAADGCDGIDQDCDGFDDECPGTVTVVSLAEADSVIEGDEDHQGTGWAVDVAPDLTGDGVDDLVIGVPGMREPSWPADLWLGNTPGGAVIASPITPGPMSIASFPQVVVGSVYTDGSGENVSAAGDVDGDGCNDLLVAAATFCCGGYVDLMAGPVDGRVLVDSESAAILQGSTEDGQLGTSMSPAGDQDGDGYADFVVGDPTAGIDGFMYPYGAVYLVHGPVSSEDRVDIATVSMVFWSNYDTAYTGYSVDGRGDLDGDGVNDVVIGAPDAVHEGRTTGGAFVFYGPIDGDRYLSDADLMVFGDRSGDALGISVTATGDFDGDGLDDVLVGNPGCSRRADHAGGATIVYSPTYGVVEPADAGALIASSVAGPGMGRRTAAGDVNGDGFDDIALASYADGESGSVYVLFGPVWGNVPIEDATYQLTGVDAGETAGRAIAAGDIDGDAISELVVGSINTTYGGSRTYVVGRAVFGE